MTSSGPLPRRDLLGGMLLTALLAVISVLLMVTVHRHTVELGGIDWPTGLLLGAAFQLAASLFVWATTGTRIALVVLAAVWGIAVMPLTGPGVGGGVLMPAVVGDQMQYSGYAVQLLGVGIPFAVLGVITVQRRRRRARSSRPAA